MEISASSGGNNIAMETSTPANAPTGRRESEGDVVFYIEEPKAGEKNAFRCKLINFSILLYISKLD